MSQFDFPITVYAATGKTAGIYRKPRTGMWSEMLGDLDLDERGSIDMAASFFVGDAAGRPSEGGKGKDFSCSDRDLAANIGINFLTPEEYFTKEDPRTFIRNFEPESYLETIPTLGEDCPPPFARKNALEIVVFCGRPAAGKSSFYWKYLEPLGYERVNQDLLKTRERCLESALQHLAEGKSVAVDNTNADRDTRIKWIQLGAKKGASVRCLKFTASTDICKHNNIVRGLNGPLMNPEGRPILPMLALVGYASRYQEPSLEEGFQDITAVDFKFSGSEQQRAVWKRYWI
ncbi:MAG: hypothetical protein M1829_002878 [Trizodia sp. TS-e1964]|nr:MAG: hypothetical protein M1829_002878 [Trizodia sp. TS-e1964]